jgi:hypothetical protein
MLGRGGADGKGGGGGSRAGDGRGEGGVRSVAGVVLKPLVHWPTRVGWWPWVQWVLGPASWLQWVGKKT